MSVSIAGGNIRGWVSALGRGNLADLEVWVSRSHHVEHVAEVHAVVVVRKGDGLGLSSDCAFISGIVEVESNVVGVFAIGSHSSVPDFGRWALGFKAVSSLWGSWILESIKGAVEKSVSVGARSINGIVDLAMSVERVEAWETSLS